MLNRLQTLVIRVSQTWWLYLFVVLLFAGSLLSLLRIGEIFPSHAAGNLPFDLQNALTAAEVYPQLATWTENARNLYYAFTLIDYAFPFFAGLFIAATAAFAMRNSLPKWYAALAARNLLPVFMLGTAFDWLENLAALGVIGLHPAEIGWLPFVLVIAKKLKLVCVMSGQAAMLLLLVYAAGNWLAGKLRIRR
ncbi:MAG: hypothetical protein JNJ67_10055 [Chromatiales bacterium]|jgi:hypothetical protein|nr:hypothetical protein [Chromatiales bacterium]